MQIVINLDDKVKDFIDQCTTDKGMSKYVEYCSLSVAKAIKDGVVLSKGHSDLNGGNAE